MLIRSNPQAMTTNLLAMPLVNMAVFTGNNEDWVDSILYLIGTNDPLIPVEELPQLDLRGIEFQMEVRRLPPDNEVVIRASTKDGTLGIGEPPNFGFLLINVPHAKMKIQTTGNYVADILGMDVQNQRVVIQIALEIFSGITRP